MPMLSVGNQKGAGEQPVRALRSPGRKINLSRPGKGVILNLFVSFRCHASALTISTLSCMDKNDDKRHQLVSSVLAITAGASQAELVAQALQAWERLAAHLCPLVGDAGFT